MTHRFKKSLPKQTVELTLTQRRNLRTPWILLFIPSLHPRPLAIKRLLPTCAILSFEEYYMHGNIWYMTLWTIFFTQYHSFRFLQIFIQLIINIYRSEYISISLVIQSEINIWFFFYLLYHIKSSLNICTYVCIKTFNFILLKIIFKNITVLKGK